MNENATNPSDRDLPPMSEAQSQLTQTLLMAGMMAPPPQPGPLGAVERYVIHRLLGQGGMGQVLLALDPASGERVAIKMIRPDLVREPLAVRRFLTEAQHMHRMSHPHILRVLEVREREAGSYYVMPYVAGGSLAERIKPGQPLPREEILPIGRQIAAALSYAHGRGIIHRDLKPANVLLDPGGQAYLTDFGLLRTVFNDSLVDVRRSSIEGTAPYLSPSAAAGKAEDTRCDIYAFGAMLYEMLTGHKPYEGEAPAQVIEQILAGPPRPIGQVQPDAPAGLARIAEWAMARELRDRYAEMGDVLRDLDRVAAGQAPLGPHGQGAGAAGRTGRRALAGSLAAALVLVLAGLAVWHSWSRPPAAAGAAAAAAAPSAGGDGAMGSYPQRHHERMARRELEPAADPARQVTLNFLRAPLRLVVDFYAQLTGKSVIVSPQVAERTCILKSNGPIPREEAVRLIEAYLSSAELTVTPVGQASLRIDPAPPQPAAGAMDPPRIVSISPPLGSSDVDPAVAEIAVAFDRDMRQGFSWTGGGPVMPPPRPGLRPFWRDPRTCVLPVALETGRFYRVGINSKSHQNFRSAAGVPVRPSVVYFATRGATREVLDQLQPPVVVDLQPPNHAQDVDPRTSELRVTFSVPMGGGRSWTGGGETFPPPAEGKESYWTADQRTCVLPVRLESNHTYCIGLNSPSHNNFQSAAGVPLAPVEYTFRTGP